MKIGEYDTEKQVLVVAEIGNNHEGSYALAEEMIVQAANAGVGAVKLQTFRTEHYVSSKNESRFEMLRSFELTQDEFRRLKNTADTHGVLFISTPFDTKSAEFLNDLVVAFKIASGDNTFYPLLETVASFDKPVILSSGLATMSQLNYSKTIIEHAWQDKGIEQELAVLHCVTGYPVPVSEANLAVIRRLQSEMQCVIGYSDHTLGIEAAVFSVAAGARIVEKHFTLDKNHSDFRDHQLSADPKELAQLVDRIRSIEVLMGSGEKTLQRCEAELLKQMRRSIVAARDMANGEIVGFEDITWVRPSGGIPPGKEKLILGKTLNRKVMAGEPFTLDMLN